MPLIHTQLFTVPTTFDPAPFQEVIREVGDRLKDSQNTYLLLEAFSSKEEEGIVEFFVTLYKKVDCDGSDCHHTHVGRDCFLYRFDFTLALKPCSYRGEMYPRTLERRAQALSTIFRQDVETRISEIIQDTELRQVPVEAFREWLLQSTRL